MSEKKLLTGSIVLFNERPEELSKAMNSFLGTTLPKKLFLIDNSDADDLRGHFTHPDVEYIFNKENIGFGAGHNTILERIKNLSEYHLVMNPDVSFDPGIIDPMINQMSKDQELALIAPEVRSANGEHQITSRRYPTLFELIVRRTWLLKKLFPGLVKKGEYRERDLTQAFHPDFLHGCFLLFRTSDLLELRGFDSRYFLYMEDVDICRELDKIGRKKMYFPKVEIVHLLKKGSSKNLKLFLFHLASGIKYFKKWGF